MNTNPVSFGRTIKVNAPIPIAKHAADLINSVQNRKGESRVQQQLKGLFFDLLRYLESYSFLFLKI